MAKSDAMRRMEIACFGRVFSDSENEDEPIQIKSLPKVPKRKKRGKGLTSESESGLDIESAKKSKNISNSSEGKPEEKLPVWVDEDDEIGDVEGIRFRKGFRKVKGKEGAAYKTRLEESFQLVHGPTPSWAILGKKKDKGDDSDEDGEEDVGLSSRGKASSILPRHELSILKVLDLNNDGHEKEVIRSVEFHPKLQVGLVAGVHKKVSLYKVDGRTNSLVQSACFDDIALNQATFACDGSEFYVSSGKMNHFWTYDIISGKITRAKPCHLTRQETIRKLVPSPDNKILATLGHHGNIYLHSKESKEIVGSLTTNGEVSDVQFNSTGSFMYATTMNGEIYKWDMRSRDCIAKVTDNGSINTSRIAVGSELIACGSTSGVVNVYRADDFKETHPKPLKSFMNLTTGITSLKFNHTGEILAMASLEKPNAIRLAHMPSMTVYSNFPYVNAFWNRTNSVAFSPNSGYFSIGNNQGSAYLFRIKHFDNY